MWLRRLGGQDVFRLPGQRERYRLIPGKKQFTLEMEGSVSWKGLRCIQTGLIVGSAEKRFEPSIQLALSICDKDKLPYVNLSSEEQDVIRYLKGETLQDVTVLNEGMLKQTENYVLVCVDGFALGWGKYMQNGMLKTNITQDGACSNYKI